MSDLETNTFRVTCVEENDDGSVLLEVELGSDEMQKRIFDEGINFLLLKGALEGTTDDIIRWVQRGRQEEKTDRLIDEFNKIYNEDTK